MNNDRVTGVCFTRQTPGNSKAPKTIDYSNVDFGICGDLLSFYVRTVNILVSKDLHEQMEALAMIGGTDRMSTLLLISANPGLRPSVLAHFILKDRSAMGKLLEQMEQAGLLEQRVASAERRARELYLTPKGQTLVQQVREVARRQSDDFFSVLANEEQDALLRILRKVYENYIDRAPYHP